MIAPPVYVSPRAHIAPGATVGPDAVIEDGATVPAGAAVSRSILWPGASPSPGETLHGTILTPARRVTP